MKKTKFDPVTFWFCAVPVLLLAACVALYFILMSQDWSVRDNKHLTLQLESEKCYTGHFEGTVVFKNDYKDITLDITYKDDPQYPVKVTAYNTSLKDPDGNEVTSVKAGVTYRFLADADLEHKQQYTLYYAGEGASNDSSSYFEIFSGGKRLVKVKR